MKDEYISKSEKDTEKIAEKFAHQLTAGDVVFLMGDLGAGKTTFVRAIAKTLGVHSRVLSPTFSLIRSHSVSKNKKIKQLHHVDLYRVENADNTVGEILKEFQEENDGVMLVEWPKEGLNFENGWIVNIQESNGNREVRIVKKESAKALAQEP